MSEETTDDVDKGDEPSKCGAASGSADDVVDHSHTDAAVEKAKPLALEDEDEKKNRDASLSPEQKQENVDRAKQLRQEGNEHFRNGRYEESSEVYQNAIKACPFDESPELSVLYSNLAAALMQMSKYDDAVNCLNRSVTHNPNFVKAYLRRAKAYEHLDKLDEALEDYKKVIELDPGVTEARRACMELPPKINERNERLKSEMMDKLKQLGNMVLRPFGLSTDSFELKQDSSTGSYSINMKK